MEHDRKCEKDGVLRSWRKVPDSERFMRLLEDHEDLCACMARSWGLEVPLEVGIRLAEKKAVKLYRAWERMVGKSPSELGKEYGQELNARLNGLNVINLQDHRDA